MANFTGPAAPNANGFSLEENVEDVPCIVKFRPCKDWRGEYGFDWVREGKEDFEERFNRALDTAIIASSIIKEKMGRRNYAIWKESVEQEALQNKKQDPYFSCEEYIGRQYVKKLKDLGLELQYDSHAWEKDYFNDERNNKIEEKYTEADDPLEYLYHPKYIKRVKYEVNRKEYGNVWITSEFQYEDMANGFHEALDNIGVMDSFVKICGKKYSVFGGKTTAYYPLYSDLADLSFPDLMDRDDRDTEKTITYELHGYKLIIDYYKNNGKKIVRVIIHPKDREEKEYKIYCNQDGNKFWVPKNNNMVALDDLVGSEKELYDHLKSVFITNNIRRNFNMDIAHLCADKTLDNITVTIKNPNSMVKKELPINDITRDKQNHLLWNGNRIETWKEDYENSFRCRWFRMPEKDVTKYCVPVLSMSSFPFKKTRFLLNNYSDAPSKAPLPWDEASIQVLVEGECPKLVFKPMMNGHEESNIIELSRTEIPNPLQKEEITVKIHSHSHYNNNIIYLEAFCEKKDKTLIPVGSLKIQILNVGTIHVNVVKVLKEGDVFESNYAEAIEDQMDYVVDSFGQAGINVDINTLTLTLNRQSEERIMKNGKWRDEVEYYDSKTNSWEGAEKDLVDMLREDLLIKRKEYLMDNISIFCVNCTYDIVGGSVSGFSNVSVNNAIVMFKAMAEVRSDCGHFMHECGHALMNMHHFQRFAIDKSNDDIYAYPDAYCFRLSQSSNVMDYFTLGYSLHQYQWKCMKENLEKSNAKRKVFGDVSKKAKSILSN